MLLQKQEKKKVRKKQQTYNQLTFLRTEMHNLLMSKKSGMAIHLHKQDVRTVLQILLHKYLLHRQQQSHKRNLLIRKQERTSILRFLRFLSSIMFLTKRSQTIFQITTQIQKH